MPLLLRKIQRVGQLEADFALYLDYQRVKLCTTSAIFTVTGSVVSLNIVTLVTPISIRAKIWAKRGAM